jgi:SAM-dependent methyltransferase
VATDINPRFLGRIGAPNLEVRKHDVLKDELEKDAYDLVHCRKLLGHLPDPEKALKKMADAVRPAGWLLIEEDDLGSYLSMDVTDPSLAPIVAALRACFDVFGKKGISDDAYFGRRLRSLVEGLGFVDVGQEGFTRVNRGTDPMAGILAATRKVGEKNLITAGLITQEQWRALPARAVSLNHVSGLNGPRMAVHVYPRAASWYLRLRIVERGEDLSQQSGKSR